MNGIILSNKGLPLKCVNGYLHRKKKVHNSTIYWVCVQSDCKGKVTTVDGTVISGPRDHYHEPSSGEIVSRKQRNMVKDDASSNPTKKCREIYETANSQLMNQLPFDQDLIRTNLKPFEGLKSTINRVKKFRFPPLPRTISDLYVPEAFQKTLKDERFLLADNLDNANRILIFGSPSFLRILCNEKRVFADGTFKCVPKLFNSLYTFHVMRDGMMITALYCLLMNRTTATYVTLFRMIQDECFEQGLIFNPESFTIDFEKAMISAINIIFPRTVILGCLFHFSQCLRRKVQKLGLTCQYAENDGDNEIQKTVRRVAALALIKLEDVNEAFEDIVNEAPEDSLLDKFMEYFFNNFFKSDARFKRETWNHFSNDGPRTNNHVEGWHHAFNQRIGRNHANIWFFFEKVIQQHEVFENNLLMARHGNSINPRNRKFIMRDRRIEIQKVKYEQGLLTRLQYLDSVRYNFALNISDQNTEITDE